METNYHISVIQSKVISTGTKLFVDEVEQENVILTLINDHIDHRIEFHLGISS